MSTKLNERYNWIDWTKSIGIFLVVWGHTPITPESGYIYKFLWSFHMPLFLLISGYLYKEKTYFKDECRKDLVSLVIPYFIYQAIFYPYWLIREILSKHELNISEYIFSPIIDSLLSLPINGPTWFIFSLFFTRLLSYWILKDKKYSNIYFIFSSIVVIGSCLFLNNHDIHATYASYQFLALLPFFFIGYWIKQNVTISSLIGNRNKCIILFLISTGICTGLCSIATEVRYTTIYNMLLFYIAGLSGSFMVISVSFLLNGVKNKIVYNLSIGTLVILGGHWMIIGIFNFIMEKYLGIANITYSATTSFILGLANTLSIYPIILFCKKHAPILMGKRNQNTY